MTWTAAIMRDDNLDPDSLVGRMLGVTVKPTSNPDQIRSSDVRPELLAEATEFLDEYADDFTGLAASERAELPLWRVMDKAANPFHFANRGTHGDIRAAEIEAVRDRMFPAQEEPSPGPHMGNFVDHALWKQRQGFREYLTKQARIARECQP